MTQARSTEDRAGSNRGVFDAPGVAARYSEFWGDHGEIAALLSIADEVRGEPILDIGVGAGRTTWFMRLLTAQYIGIDFAPSMVTQCQENFPEVDIRLGDARELDFPDDSFALVTFSNNGLDAVGHEDRASAMAEIARVTKPGGLVFYSTHNRRGSSFAETPWQVHRPYEPMHLSVSAAASALLHAPSRISQFRTRYHNYAVTRQAVHTEPDWAMAPLRAHDYQLVTHFISVPGILDELRLHGLQLVSIYSLEGQPVSPSDTSTHTHYFHVIARKTVSGPATEEGASR